MGKGNSSVIYDDFSFRFLNILFLTLVLVEVKSQIVVPEPKLYQEVSRQSTEQVTIRSKENCSSKYYIGNGTSRYDLRMKWSRYECSNQERGFTCEQTFYLKNNFATYGTHLCIDLQGLQYDIKANMNQLYLTVRDKGGDLKRVYSITRLLPENAPYYVCTHSNRDWIKVNLQVRSSVQMCPIILNDLFSHEFRMGSVMSRAVHPIANVDLKTCDNEPIPFNNSFLVKVYTGGTRNECKKTMRLTQPYSYVRGCLKVVAFSQDFSCHVKAKIYTDKGDDEVSVTSDRSLSSDEQVCETFSQRNGMLVLSISNCVTCIVQSECSGQFAIQADFRQVPPPDRDDDDDDDSDTSPNLYIAVFITLIAICLVCLGLTCLCCVRFRAKRLRRLNTRRQTSSPNECFHGDAVSNPPMDPNVTWNPAQPEQLHSFLSYDDNSKIGPPPSYDSVYPLQPSCPPTEQS